MIDLVNELEWSHPEWVRGLKLMDMRNTLANAQVAPRVGAWIETAYWLQLSSANSVAPRVGAWIETPYFYPN